MPISTLKQVDPGYFALDKSIQARVMFTSSTMQIWISCSPELDTVADFVAYLTRKEALFSSGKVVSATGEEDLLAYYLTHTDPEGEHDFVVPPDKDVVRFDHFYRTMRDNHQYIAKKSADRISYLIDRLIEHVFSSAASRTLIAGNELPVSDYEKALRVLAAESRLSRRNLAKALVDLLSAVRVLGRPRSSVVRGEKSRRGYCFLVIPCPKDRDYNKHRLSRLKLLGDYCKVMKIRFPDLEHIVGYATEPLDGERRSEDLAYIDATNWTEADFQEARSIQRESGILAAPTVTHIHETEYPAPAMSETPEQQSEH